MINSGIGKIFAALALMLLVGCATLAPTGGEVPFCLPPGVDASFLTWPVVMSGPGVVFNIYGFGIRYERDGQAVQVLWMDGVLVFVDPQPDVMDQPGWGRISGQPCAWRRLRGREV